MSKVLQVSHKNIRKYTNIRLDKFISRPLPNASIFLQKIFFNLQLNVIKS